MTGGCSGRLAITGENNKPDANVPTLQPVAESASPHVKQAVGEVAGRPQRPVRSLSSHARGRNLVGRIHALRVRLGAPFLDRGAAAEADSFRRPASTRRSSPASACWPCSPPPCWPCVSPAGSRGPWLELAAQSQRIASLDLTETAAVHSHLSELDLLSDTLGRMRDSLRKHIAEREQSRRKSPSASSRCARWPKNSPDLVVRHDAKDATASPIRHSPKRPGSPLRR